MIELRGLHLGNIARSPAESVRPDLWPDHAWVPALGRMGGVVFDLAGGAHAAAYGGSWSSADGFSNTSAGDRFVSPATISISSAASFFFAGTIYSKGVGTSYGRVFEARGVIFNFNNALSSLDYPGAISVTGMPISTSTQSLCVAHGDGSGGLYVDGKIEHSNTTSRNASYGRSFAVGNNASGTRTSDQLTRCFFVYGATKLQPSQVVALHTDPLLPFRRRQPVFYSVPSGGGASLAASSAWRVFTAAAIDTAWAIRAALDGATAWAVLTQSGAATGWRITAASDAATGWQIAADLDTDTAWNLRAAADSPSAWRILTASEADTAWSIAADLSASTAWAILTSMDAATAWAIISAGTLLANTGWAIRTDADADTGWRLKTDTAADTAWAVRNARDAATAWDIQAALAGATSWRITTDLQADTAWTVITGMDADAAWRILRADPTGTAWRVCTDLDTPTAWAVFSDIIPEPVRVFLAPGRQFIVNAASRVLIITKPRP